MKDHLYKLLGVLLCVGISYAFVQAQTGTWSAPTATPPSGNVSAPIHVGSANQVKAGGLTVSFVNGTNADITNQLNAGRITSTVATSTNSNVTTQLNIRGTANTGIRIFDRANNTDSWQLYSNRDTTSGQSWLRLYDHQNNRDALWASRDGLTVRGGVWTGNVYTSGLQVTGGNPGPGKVLGTTDANGVVTWVTPTVTPPAEENPINPAVQELDYVNSTEDTYAMEWVMGQEPVDFCNGEDASNFIPLNGQIYVSGTLESAHQPMGTCKPEFTGRCYYAVKEGTSPRSGNRWNVFRTANCLARQAVVAKVNYTTAAVALTGNGVPVPVSGEAIGADTATLNRICVIRGYTGYYSATTGNFVSPGDNWMWRWIASRNDWGRDPATNPYATSLTCYRTS